MILITGGLGFIGAHTARAIVDLGESCVLTRHTNATVPPVVAAELGERVFVEPLDITDYAAWQAVGKRHEITGVVQLAGPGLDMVAPLSYFDTSMIGLRNLLQAATDWQVDRVSIASTIGVYSGISANPLREDQPLSMVGVHPIETFKKSIELLGTFLGAQSGLPVVNLRIAGIWGPLGRTESRFFATPRLIHAAARGERVDATNAPGYADDGLDMCYVKDVARGIALLQTAPKLSHPTYNIGGGRVTTNGEVLAAVKEFVPDARLELPAGRNPHSPEQDSYLDLSRINADTGYQPEYDLAAGVADYLGWLRAGNTR